jgi:TolA-binding protein
MTNCTGAPAEISALPYIEGALTEFELERFEEHFFDCPVCLSYVQAFQAAREALKGLPRISDRDAIREARRGSVIAWPARQTWALGAVAALLLIGVFTYRAINSPAPQPAVARNAATVPPQPAVTAEPASQGTAPVRASQIADLALPAFHVPNLRGASEEAHFQAGMNAYVRGNCAGALAELAEVPGSDPESRAAMFYSGACQMHQGKLAAAATNMHLVAGEGDSPQQESALYSLAQIALMRNDTASAHQFLVMTISLKGDLEPRARAEDRAVRALQIKDQEAGTNQSGEATPESK